MADLLYLAHLLPHLGDPLRHRHRAQVRLRLLHAVTSGRRLSQHENGTKGKAGGERLQRLQQGLRGNRWNV